MKRSFTLVVVLLAMLAGPTARSAEMPAAVASLVAAEKAFAAAAVAKSMRDAFLEYLAPDAVVFNPGPVPGRPLYEKQAADKSRLVWTPQFAEVAASGSFGYTTGPWSYASDRLSPPLVFGHFVSVWKKQPDGAWRVVLDVGVSHGATDMTPRLTFHAPGNETFGAPGDARVALMKADRALIKAIGRNSALAFDAFYSPDARVYRKGALPFLGRDEARMIVSRQAVSVGGPMEAHVADSADLGYTIGSLGTGPETYYVHIWRRNEAGDWKVVVDLMLPASNG